MKRNLLALITLCLIALTACTHPSIGKLIGGDRDEHGCKGSAGYVWSYAMHDCVRLWEAGIRMDSGPGQVFLIFSEDSTFAEIFPPEGESVICKRKRNSSAWYTKQGEKAVYYNKGELRASVNGYTYCVTP